MVNERGPPPHSSLHVTWSQTPMAPGQPQSGRGRDAGSTQRRASLSIATADGILDPYYNPPY